MVVYFISLVLFLIDIAAQNYCEYQLVFALLSLYCVCLFMYRHNISLVIFQVILLMLENFIISNSILFSVYSVLSFSLIGYSLYAIILPTATFFIYFFFIGFVLFQWFFVMSINTLNQDWIICTIQQISVNIIFIYLILKLFQQRINREGRLGNRF